VKQSAPGGVQLREAIGRGVALVDGGQVALPCEPRWYPQRPRTTVGWDAQGTWMTLSLPGSGYDRNGYRVGGLGLAQEANVAAALGFVEASELDGGGSATAVVRRADGDWDRVDDPDNLWQRPIPNALIWVKPTR
ncbi:MAG TPA: phosphodiester glycosidase family protein, partial [Actinomycetes bacterium]|nr:phosphodiester glycosidase family protein [Actinomycetes bacterium]